MFSLETLLGQQQGAEAVSQVSRQVGAEPELVNTAIQMALPALINGLANNVATPEGAQSLDNALQNDNHAGILDNLSGLGSMIFGGGQTPPGANAGGILGHILGNSQGAVAQQISNQSGLSIGQVAQILMFLAPIVMGYLGKQKQENNLDAGGLASILLGQQQQIQQNPQSSFITQMLDSDGDGSALDDIASIAFKYITNR
jgi:hypothetical protein